MVAIEEELVAGESPDKSVDEGASGAAMSSAERDPRLSVFRPRDPEPGAGGENRDPLRDAVAAWVATTEDGTESSGRVDSDADAAPDAGADAAPDAGADADADADSDADAAPPAPASTPDRPSAPSGSDRTVAFRAPSPTRAEPEPARAPAEAAAKAPAPASGEAGTSAAEPAAPAPAPAAPKQGPAKAEAPTRGEGGTDSAAEGPAHDSERTAVFRAVRPGAGTDAPASAAGKPGGGERSPAAGSGAGAGAGAARTDSASASGADRAQAADASAGSSADDSGRTAVFRAVRPDSPARGAGSASDVDGKAAKPAPESARDGADSATKGFGASGAPARTPGSAPADRPADSASGSGAGKPAAGGASADDSERTAVFRAVRPGPAPAQGGSAGGAKGSGSAADDAPAAKPGSGSADDSERTAVFRAPKVDSGSATAGKGADEAADSERTAVFRAVKPGVKAPAAAPAKDSAPAKDAAPAKDSAPEKPAASRPVPPKAVGGERASTFVPLRKDDGPAPKPASASAPAAAPAAPAPAAPARTAPAPAPTPVPERSERTTQQPLPPKPPLDMLADLTNNPPPPPSPMRTAIRRFKIYAPLVVLLAIVLAVVQLVRPMPEPKLTMTARSSYTFDGGNPVLPWPKEGQAYMAAAGLGTVGSFGEQKPVAIGSVAKTMTAYVILKDHPLKKGEKGPMIDIDQTAVDDGAKSSEGESTVGTLKAGDKISEYDALAAIMIPSANNVARLLARWDAGGDQEAFVKKMNEAAKELGMANTTYTDPSGLDATTVSTAEDQVKLGLKVVEMPELVAITKLPEWTDQYGKKWRNYNTLIPGNGALGIKTGSTTKAGGNLLFAAEKQVGKTRQLIVGAVLGQYGVPILDTAIAASKQVMLATQKMLVNAPVVKKGDVVGYVDDGLGGHTPVVATADVEAVGWPSLTVNVKLGSGDGKLPQTAKAGTEIGVLTVGEGASQVKVPVALQSDLAAPGIGSKLTRVG
ncbi:D-alanyl-D-alanine carboxypeptidase [Streptomyces vinaceus]|uniref:D-alanyl-D-alanine carboxypeptidase n=1 Tax=Streptomyces vinaceus TaxID=1960 RepID=UPI0037F10C20